MIFCYFLDLGIETVLVIYNLKAMEVVYSWRVLQQFGLKMVPMRLKFTCFFIVKKLCIINKKRVKFNNFLVDIF